MRMFAPAACSVRAISAPTRRAPPVIKTTWSRNGEFSILDFMPRNDTPTAPQREIVLNDLQARHLERVHEHLAAHMAAAGWLSFERFMELALYAPGLGYYSAGAHKFCAGSARHTSWNSAPAADVLRPTFCCASRLWGRCPIVTAFWTSARTCANVSAAISTGTCRRACRSASAGSISLPRSRSTASFWPTKCWMLCPLHDSAGTAAGWRNSVSRSTADVSSGERGRQARRRLRNVAGCRPPAVLGTTAMCRNIVLGSPLGRIA